LELTVRHAENVVLVERLDVFLLARDVLFFRLVLLPEAVRRHARRAADLLEHVLADVLDPVRHDPRPGPVDRAVLGVLLPLLLRHDLEQRIIKGPELADALVLELLVLQFFLKVEFQRVLFVFRLVPLWRRSRDSPRRRITAGPTPSRKTD